MTHDGRYKKCNIFTYTRVSFPDSSSSPKPQKERIWACFGATFTHPPLRSFWLTAKPGRHRHVLFTQTPLSPQPVSVQSLDRLISEGHIPVGSGNLNASALPRRPQANTNRANADVIVTNFECRILNSLCKFLRSKSK